MAVGLAPATVTRWIQYLDPPGATAKWRGGAPSPCRPGREVVRRVVAVSLPMCCNPTTFSTQWGSFCGMAKRLSGHRDLLSIW